MKILVLSGWYPGPLEPLNGDFVKEQVRLLRGQGLHIDVAYVDLNIAYLKGQQWSAFRKIKVDDRGNKEYIKQGPFWPKNTPWGLKLWVKAYVQWIFEYMENEGVPDAIHAHTYLGAAVAREINQLKRIPYVVTTHFTGWLNGTIKKFHSDLGVTGLKSAKTLTAVSAALAEDIAARTDRPVEVLHNFIDTKTFTYRPRRLVSKKTIPVFRAISIGDLIPRKQVNEAIRAISIINDNREDIKIHLEIIGHGQLSKALEKLVVELEQSEFISFVGSLNKSTVAQKLQNAHMLIHTSSLETFGLVIAEALCCGVPTISYQNKGVVEMQNLPGIHLCQEPTIDSLVQRIAEVIDNYDTIDQERISQQARRALGIEAKYHQLKAIYNDLLV